MSESTVHTTLTPSAVSASPGALVSWFTVLMLCIAQIVSTIDRGMLALVVAPVREELGISDVQIALLQGFAFSFFYVIAGVVFGLITDIVNRKWLLIGGISVWSAATVVSGLADSFGHLFAARLFVGIGEAVLAPCAVTIIADLFPVSRRGRPMSLYIFGSMTAFGIGSVVTGFILEAAPEGVFEHILLLEGRAPWRIAFILAGFFGLLVAALFLFTHDPKSPPEQSGGADKVGLGQGLQTMLERWKIYLPFYMTLALFGMGISVIFNWSPSLLTRVYAFPIDQVSKLLGYGHIIWAAVGAFCAGVIAEKVGAKHGASGVIGLAAVASLSGVVSSLAILTSSGTVAIVLLSSITLSAAIFGVSMLSVVAEIAPARMKGFATSLYAFFMTLVGASMGPLLVAFLTTYLFRSDDSIGWAIAIIGTASFILAAMLAALSAKNLRALVPVK